MGGKNPRKMSFGVNSLCIIIHYTFTDIIIVCEREKKTHTVFGQMFFGKNSNQIDNFTEAEPWNTKEFMQQC